MTKRKMLGLGMAISAAVAGFNPSANAVTVGTFTGGDAGEGLDLDGNFVYAVNARGPAVGLIREANFTTDSTPGVSLSSGFEILNWHAPSYGASVNDDRLEVVMQSIRWSLNSDVTVSANGLIPGRQYKLQLLFGDQGNGRNMDLELEGSLLVNNFIPGNFQLPTLTTGGALITETFIAGDNQLNFRLTPSGTFPPPGPGADNNPILSGFTLELLPVPEPATAVLLALGSAGLLRRRRRADA